MFCAHVFVGVHAFVHMCMWRLVDFGYLLSMSTSFFFETRLLTEPRAHPLTRVTGHQFSISRNLFSSTAPPPF